MLDGHDLVWAYLTKIAPHNYTFRSVDFNSFIKFEDTTANGYTCWYFADTDIWDYGSNYYGGAQIFF